MNSDANDDERKHILPPGAAPGAKSSAGFEKTEWSGASALPPPAEADKTQLVQPPPEMGSGLPVGTRLGEFEVTSLLGEGGFGIVYLAADHSLQRRVALKEYMPAALAQRMGGSQVQVKSERHRETFEAGRRSFINEARLLAQFDHPSLVKVYRFWEANGTAYMVMPFYEGKTLRDTLRGRAAASGTGAFTPPDEAWLRTLLQPLTEALLVIHAEQCYHRDIAPDNIMMLAGSQRPLLLDFGAARRVIGDMTQALTVILKPGYAPVEQYAEIPGMKQGPWTDVYALAAVVYFAIIGKTPPPSVGRLLNDTYVPLAQAAAGRYSAGFLQAIDHALAVRPDERTQSITALRDELGLGPSTRAAPHESPFPAPVSPRAPPKTTPPTPPMPAEAGPAGKSHSALTGIGLAAVGLAALGFGGWALFGPAKPPSPAPTTAAAAAAPSPAPPPAAVLAPSPSFDVSQEFARVVQAQSAGFDLHLQTNKTRYRIGKDELQFTLQSAREGHVYVFAFGADGVLVELYPKVKQGALKIRAGQPLKLPQGQDVFVVTAPAGPTDLLVMVSAQAREHSALQPKADGAFRVFPTGAQAAALAAKVLGPLPALAGRAVCGAGGPCDESYGAALVRVEVVN